MTKVAVIAPHPDDETLGCGGTLLKHRASGDSISWIIISSKTKKYGFSMSEIKQREQEIKRVSQLYNFTKVINLNLPTMHLDQIPLKGLVESISTVITKVEPYTLYLPNRSDVHSDHRIVFQAAWCCCKAFRFPFIKRVLMYEIPSETDFAPALPESVFLPTFFSNISQYLNQKIKIMQQYKSELCYHPFPRSRKNIKALATVRGATAGVPYAEAFMLIREIQ